MSLELIRGIAKVEGLEIFAVTSDTVFVSIGEELKKYNPITDDRLNHYLQNKYKICVDYKKEEVYTHRLGESYKTARVPFCGKPNRAICECIVKKETYYG